MIFKSIDNVPIFILARRGTAVEIRACECALHSCSPSERAFCPVTVQALESLWQGGQGIPHLGDLLLCSHSRCHVQLWPLRAHRAQSCTQGWRWTRMKRHRDRKVNSFCQRLLYIHGEPLPHKETIERFSSIKELFILTTQEKNASQTLSSLGHQIALLIAFLIKKPKEER